MKSSTFQSFEPNALPLDAFEMDTSTAEKPILKTKGGWKYDAGSLNTPDLTECTDPDAANDSLIIYDASAGGNKKIKQGLISAPPIGFVYIQGANDAAPGTLWPGTTWSDVSSEEAGRFRRIKGTYSPPNGGSMGIAAVGGTQDHAMQGFITLDNGYQGYGYGDSTYSGSLMRTANTDSYGITYNRKPRSDGVHGTPQIDYENRPAAVGVVKWRRTA